jgi:(E)-4-hydroxy-3-methylbut-2-enyl-diphosphate synthase
MHCSQRRKAQKIKVRDIAIGGDSPISIQSMTKTDTRNISATMQQIKRLQDAGCDIVRIAIPDAEACKAFKQIRLQTDIPLVADIHFDYRLALMALEYGADKIRINPGNIGSQQRIKKVVDACKAAKIPMRIGVNAGSLEKDILKKYKNPSAEAMVESAFKHISLIEGMDFEDLIISLKSSNVLITIKAYQLLAEKVNYPFHIGISEAGAGLAGVVKSATGLAILLWEGIGDTIRISLTGDPVQEVKVAMSLLRSLNLREQGAELISCPTCGRCHVDLLKIIEGMEEKISHIKHPIKIAVMGCEVNGPGEAREADIGYAAGKGGGLIFKKGKIIKKIAHQNAADELMHQTKELIKSLYKK